NKIYTELISSPIFFKTHPWVTNITRSRSVNSFSSQEMELIFGENPSEDIKKITNDIIKNIGFEGINLEVFKGNVESFSEHFEFYENEEGKQEYRINFFYNQSYFERLLENNQLNEVKIMILHELGHFIKNNYSGKMAELEADRFAGFMMGSRFRNLIGRADMLKVGRGLFENFESDELYPSVEERLEFLLLGWDEIG